MWLNIKTISLLATDLCYNTNSGKGIEMELQKILAKLDIPNMTIVTETKTPTNIQTYKLLTHRQDAFYSPCLYVGYASDLPEKFEGSASGSIIFIDDALLSKEIAGSTGVNLYRVPADVVPSDVLNAVADILNDETTIVAAMRRILDTLYSSSGLQALVDIASEVFENPIFISDTAFKILAMSGKTIFMDETLEYEKKMGYVHMDNMESVKQSGDLIFNIRHSDKVVFHAHPVTGKAWLFKSVKIHGIAVADIALVENDRQFRELDRELLEHFSQIVAIEMEKTDFYKENRGIMFNYFLSDLLSDKIQNKKEIIQRVRILDLKLYRWYQMIVISDNNRNLTGKKRQYISEQLRQLIPDCRWTTYGEKLVVFLNRQSREMLLENEYITLQSFLKDNNLSAGFSRPYTDLLETSYHCQMALSAVDTGITINHSSGIYKYEDMLLYYVAKILSEKVCERDLCPESVTALQEYDNARGTALLETLKIYLLYTGDPASAAKALNIHYNSLLYRVNKIRELTDIDLSNGEERLKIQLYLKFMEYQNKSLYSEG